MKIENINPKSLKEYEKNPRFNDDAVEYVKNSIEEFGFKVPIIVDDMNTIIAGHTRKKAAVELGLKTVPVIRADDLTDRQVRAFRIADNKVAEYSEWDDELLEEELSFLKNDGEGSSMQDFGFESDVVMDNDFDIEEGEADDNPYSLKVDAPVYEITGEMPELSELVDDSKQQELSERIEAADIDEDVKQFLHQAAQRHVAFDYKAIAEYYAHADKEVQALMEDSALVIIDYHQAIEKGFVKLTSKMQAIAEEDDVDYVEG